MWEQNIIEQIEPAYILTAGFKWKGEKVQVYTLWQTKGDYKAFLAKIHKLLDDAEVITWHNGDKFDAKWINKELIRHGFFPPSPYKSIDTLKIARSKFNFPSNKLDDLGAFLGVGRKVKHEGFPLWKTCMLVMSGVFTNKVRNAFKRMADYNAGDIVLLEAVAEKLLPWSNISLNNGINCPVCGSQRVWARGWHITKAFITKRYQCQSCGKWSLSNQKERHTDEYIK